MKNLFLFTFLFALLSINTNISAQIIDPVHWKYETHKISGNDYELIFHAQLDKKWHIYSQFTPNGGPLPLFFEFEPSDNYTLIGKVEEPKPEREYDEVFGVDVLSFKDKVDFIQKVKILTDEPFVIKGYSDYQTCIEGKCIPGNADFVFSINGGERTSGNENVETGEIAKTFSVNNLNLTIDSSETTTEVSAESEVNWWDPVIEILEEYESDAGNPVSRSLLLIFIAGFLGGLIALVTPCVWPMIPMTVSFFIKQSDKGRSKGIQNALIYGLSIIVIYVLLGLGVTMLFGADALNAMSTGAIFNLFFFVLLVVFAAAFLGAFELTLPSSWVNAMDQKADKTSGLLSIFLMAFTLALVSFSCTGPIIGTLLVEAVTQGAMAPLIGMTGFALALAIPFSVFAIFPSWMNSMPKSGGWLNSVKVVLGFLELALAFKFLSNADLAYHWGILDREVFLVLWIVIFASLGFYLLGKLKFAHDSDVKHVGVLRYFMALISLAFALYMVPGLWGAPLKAISAFSPPQFTQDFDLYDGSVHAKFEDYDVGMAYAKSKGLPVMVDFTGWGCVNCRNMEAAVWTDSKVKDYLENKYVLISLYVDDKTELPEKDKYVSESRGKKIRTIGNKWSDLQIRKFGTNSQPYYFLLDNNGIPLNRAYGYDLDVEKYKVFLKEGLEEYDSRVK